MAIPNSARPTPLPPFQRALRFIDQSGQLDPIAHQTQEQLRNYVQGAGRIIPCSASSASNVITLTPNDASPSLEGYVFGDCFAFWADATSTGSVTATVVPKKGSLDTLKVYLADSVTQAGSGDVIANQLYVAFYLPIADSSAGGFVLYGINAAPTQVSGGSFTAAAAASTNVANTNVTSSSAVVIMPTNVAAANRQAGATPPLYVSAKTAGVGFTVSTTTGAAAAGTETYDYVVVD